MEQETGTGETRKTRQKPERSIRQKTKAMKKTTHRKRTTASSDPAADDDVGNPDLEVELDSLGLFFMRLIDDDICQDDAEASHADVAEVIILSSDSDPLPSLKFRQANLSWFCHGRCPRERT